MFIIGCYVAQKIVISKSDFVTLTHSAIQEIFCKAN